MKPTRRPQRFFATPDVAESYDVTVDLAAPYYGVMHQVLLELVTLQAQKVGHDVAFDVLDIGSGTGVATLAVLDRFATARIVALDLASEMNQVLRSKLARLSKAQQARCEIVEADVLEKASQPLHRYCRTVTESTGFEVILSALTFHHFTSEEKLATYSACHDALAPGGVLINADFFEVGDRNDASEVLLHHGLSTTLTWIGEQFDSTPSRGSTMSRRDRGRLREQWLDHVRHEHFLDSMQTQAAMLKQVGFSAVECPFRYWQSGVLWASKAKASKDGTA